MQPSAPSPRSQWRASHVPKLSYGTAIPTDRSQTTPCDASADVRNPPSTSTSARSNPTISSEASRVPSSQSRGLTVTTSSKSFQSPNTPTSPHAAKKKNNSIFAALFVKEQTSVALEQVAAQLMAQHGELTPRAVPGVSSAKMPGYVPKVNSKWDGVPEAIKQREKQEKERHRASKRYSVVSTTRSTSANDSRDRRDQDSTEATHSKTRRSSNSTLSSFDSRGGHTGQSSSHLADQSKTSLTTTDHAYLSGEVPDLASKPVSIRSQSLRSPSGSSLPEITAFFPNDIPIPTKIPAARRQEFKPETSHLPRKLATQPDSTAVIPTLAPQAPSIYAVPDHTSSPVATPHETSPVTPSPQATHHVLKSDSNVASEEEVVLVSSGANVLGPPASAKKKGLLNSAAFLAGEARPLELPEENGDRHTSESNPPKPVLSAVGRVQQNLEKRPDSSRARLGLRASMIVRADQAPWDWRNDAPDDATESLDARISIPVSHKKMLSRFAK